MTNTFKNGDVVRVYGNKRTVAYKDGPFVYFKGGGYANYQECTLQESGAKFRPGDVVRNSRGEYTIKCVKTHYDFGNEYTGPLAYDYTNDEGFDWESSLTLVRRADVFAAATPAPKFKVGDRVRCINTPDAGVGVIVKKSDWSSSAGWSVNFKDTWYGVCGESESNLTLVASADEVVIEFLKAGKFIEAIKQHRIIHGTGLKEESKEAVEALRDDLNIHHFGFAAAVAAQKSPSIVIRNDNGRYRPNDNPRVHDTTEAATKEAERLAKANPGVGFATFVLASTSTATAPTVSTVRV